MNGVWFVFLLRAWRCFCKYDEEKESSQVSGHVSQLIYFVAEITLFPVAGNMRSERKMMFLFPRERIKLVTVQETQEQPGPDLQGSVSASKQHRGQQDPTRVEGGRRSRGLEGNGARPGNHQGGAHGASGVITHVVLIWMCLHQVPVNPSLYLIKYDGFDCVYGLELHKDERVQGLEVLPDRLGESPHSKPSPQPRQHVAKLREYH